MAQLLPKLRQLVKYSRGVKDPATQKALAEIEEVLEALIVRLNALEA